MKQKNTLIFMIMLGYASIALSNRMADIQYIKHCGSMNAAECNETLEMARGTCITEEEYQTGKKENRIPWCLNGKRFLSWCSCSCFASSTRLFARENDQSAPGLKEFTRAPDTLGSYQFATLSEGSSASEISLEWINLSAWSSGPEHKPLIVIKTQDGNSLSVTGGHAMLLSSGEMVFADALQVGQSLVTVDGISVEITALESEAATEDIFNVLTSGNSLMSHLIIAEGLVVGDLAWSNSLYSEMGRVLVRQ